MNKLSIVLLFGLMGAAVSAQSISDLKNKVPGKSGQEQKQPTSSGGAIGGGSQFEMAEKFFASANAYHYTRCGSGALFMVGSTMMGGGEPVKRDDFFADVKRNEKNQIVEYRLYKSSGIEGGKYLTTDAAFPLCYKGNSGYMYFIEEYAIFTPQMVSTPSDVNSVFETSCGNVTVFHRDAKTLKTMDSATFKGMMRSYLAEAGKGVQMVRASEKDARDKAEAEKRAKYTTQGKQVTKIRVEATTDKLQQGKTYAFTIIATLKDGGEISTAAGGYSDEYEITATGLPEFTNTGLGQMKTVSGGTINVPMNDIVKGDKVVLSVKSKYHPTLTATKTFTMDYSAPVTADYNANITPNSGSSRTIAGSLRVELKAVKHGVTGENLLEYKIFNSKGNTLMHFRVNETTAVNVEVCGQPGWNADSKRPAQDGLDGGDITIVIDPSVKSYVLNTKNTGGKGGKGNSTYAASGRNGNPGRIEKINQKVSF